MLNWLKSLLRPPEPAGPPRVLQAFGNTQPTITQGGVAPSEDGWLINAQQAQTIRLFEVPVSDLEQVRLTYAAKLKAEGLEGKAFLEMWCRFPGRGEFFSKGLRQPLSGTTDWASFETSFYLRRGQKPDLVKLNLVIEGTGKVGIKELTLSETPLKS